MAKDKKRISGKLYEELIHRIYKELEPHATIKLNDKILGVSSKIEREIDISVRKKIADHEILIIIQAKDHKKRADIKVIGEFDSVIRDVRASKGILICNSGFTKTAKEYAENRAIDLCTAHDASEKDWQAEIKIPVIRKHLLMSYNFKMPFVITKDVMEYYKDRLAKMQIVTGPEGIILKTFDGKESSFLKEFRKAWEKGEIKSTEGDHTVKFDAYIDMFGNPDLFPPSPVEIQYHVKARYYLKFFTPTDYRGIKNYVTEKFNPSFIKIEGSIPFSDDKSWWYIKNPDVLAVNSERLEVVIVDIEKTRFVKTEWKKS